MAALVGRASKDALLKVSPNLFTQNAGSATFRTLKGKGKKIAAVALGTVGAGALGYILALEKAVNAVPLELHPPKYPWSHHRTIFNTFDMNSVRRGYEVYKQVCAACHTMDYIFYRDLVGTVFTEKEAKAEAAEAMIWDGPDPEGNMYQRKGKLYDTFPRPYKNAEEAAAANNGAVPPDLTFIVKGREGFEDYIFALLTGYKEAPAGMNLADGQHYNPYFLGGVISMAQALYNDIIEYTDGTKATQTQLAKDVTVFLAWAGDQEHDQRNLYTLKMIVIATLGVSAAYYMKRLKWSSVATRHVQLKKK